MSGTYELQHKREAAPRAAVAPGKGKLIFQGIAVIERNPDLVSQGVDTIEQTSHIFTKGVDTIERNAG